ncbi:MAG TPA: caspase family protein [Accumulibacter sp.]|uniref:caspase family protein n=1 Tax=Accumulibacter sp. TaxID=2053492 RepID=UPI002C3927F2|nr:caspase family protein [Accumulibacter sp.]HNN84115.1 caspase family protein [Accumulibacter sp.]
MNGRWRMRGVAGCGRLLLLIRAMPLIWRLLLPLMSLVALMPLAALAGEPTSEPLLRLETGMHTAVIKRIATDAAGRWAVTASDDKTARVWDLAAPPRGDQAADDRAAAPAVVLRPPQDAGNEGKLYAVALSPDGTTVALGGWTGGDWDAKATIYLFERASGRLLRRIGGLPNVINHLAWSPDGRWLAASLGAGNGVRVFDATSGDERGSDSDYQGDSYSAHFRADSRRLLTTAWDGKLRLYALEAGRWRLLRSAAAAGGTRPFAARFSPDGRRIALGFADSTRVQVVDGETLAEIAQPTTQGVANGDLSSVAWSADGRVLFAAGRWHVQDKSPLRRWRTADWSPLADLPLANNTIMDLAPLPDGRVLFAAGDPAWGIVSADGGVELRREPAIADLRDQEGVFALSPDARRVRFGYRQGGGDPRAFDLGQREWVAAGGGEGERQVDGRVDARADKKASGKPTARSNAKTPGGTAAGAGELALARTSAAGLELRDWKDHTRPTRNGEPLPLEPNEMSRSVAISADGEHFVLGTEWSLRFFTRSGRQLWQQPVPGVAWAVNVSADGRFVVAGYGDGTIRWHRVSDGSEVVAFFPHADRQRWIAWTPEGYYDASPGAEELIGYHLNHGRERAGEFVSAAQLRETFYQPALLARRLDADGDQRLAEVVARRGDVRQILAAGPRPQIELLSPAATTSDGDYQLQVRVRQLGQGEHRLRLRIDEQEIAGRWQTQALTPGGIVVNPLTDLAPGLRRLSVELVDGRGVASPPLRVALQVKPPASTPPPRLHVLAVGVTRYRDQALAKGVAFAADDAKAVAAAFQRGGQGVYQPGVVRVLSDAEAASKEAILAAGRKIADEVRAHDAFVLYLAGHGRTVEGDYYYVPAQVVFRNQEQFRNDALGGEALRALLASIPASKLLVLLDTCSSGSFRLPGRAGLDDKAAIDRLQRISGRALIAAAADEKMALEGEGGHGVFTYALLRALAGDAASDPATGWISVTALGEYIDRQVPAITQRKWKYQQIPVANTPVPFPIVRKPANGR